MGIQFTKIKERRLESPGETVRRFDQERHEALDGERRARHAAAVLLAVAILAIGIAFYFYTKARGL